MNEDYEDDKYLSRAFRTIKRYTLVQLMAAVKLFISLTRKSKGFVKFRPVYYFFLSISIIVFHFFFVLCRLYILFYSFISLSLLSFFFSERWASPLENKKNNVLCNVCTFWKILSYILKVGGCKRERKGAERKDRDTRDFGQQISFPISACGRPLSIFMGFRGRWR